MALFADSRQRLESASHGIVLLLPGVENRFIRSGATSAKLNPFHEYDKYKSYSVSLDVIGAEGTDVLTKSDYIPVVPYPAAILNMLLFDGM